MHAFNKTLLILLTAFSSLAFGEAGKDENCLKECQTNRKPAEQSKNSDELNSFSDVANETHEKQTVQDRLRSPASRMPF